MGIELFIEILYYSFNSHEICNDVPSFISNISNLCLLPIFFSEKAMAPHSSTFAWRVPWTEEPGRLQYMGSLELDTTE